MEEDNVIYPSQIFEILRKKFLVILLAVITCGVAAFSISAYVIKPQYTATASLYVYSNTNHTENSITTSELTASQELVNTYIVVLKSDTVLDQVIEYLNIDLSSEDIRKNMSASSIDGTEAFSIGINDINPERAQQIVNAIVDIAPEEIVRVVKAGGVEVIDYAKEPTEPSSPNKLLYTVVGALLGLIIPFGYFFVRVIFDSKIHGEDDLQSNFNIPVLGIIPTISELQVDKKTEN
jgi:capsular polysaccharide biosynthesis protein